MCIIEHPLDGGYAHSTLKMGQDTEATMATAITSPNGDTLTSSSTGGGASSPLCGNKRKYEEISMDTPAAPAAATSPVDSEMIVDVVVYVKQGTDLEGTASQGPTVASEGSDEVNDGIKACKSPRYDDEAMPQEQEEEEQRGGSAMEEAERPAVVNVKTSEGHESVLSSSSNAALTATSTTTSSSNGSSTPSVCSPFITAAPTILSPTAPILLTTPLPSEENAIAKLEAVAVPGETSWNCEPIVDSISKLQAVAVPGETWGGASDSTRSTLATTLLVADDLDDDDDDFEDDFDDDETILPGYSSMRYPCSPNRGTTVASLGGVPGGPASGYVTPAYPKPGYFPEPYQNCARTGAANNGAQQYANRGYGWAQHGYYSPPYEPPSSQQTIRCAENGKSYFELGSANYSSAGAAGIGPGGSPMNGPMGVAPPQQQQQQQQQQQPQGPFGGPGVMGGPRQHHLKRCCDGRNMSCSNKQCYKERRLKMMNLSMFKLARFRQASDQSLYRSVLICNTLKSIEREIDNENKEFTHHHQHQQQQHQQQQQQQQHHQHHQHQQHLQQQHHYHLQQQHQQQQQQQQQQHAAGMHHQQLPPPLPPPSGANVPTAEYFGNRGIGGGAPSNNRPYGAQGGDSSTITMQLSPYDQQQQQQQQHQQQHVLHPLHHHHHLQHHHHHPHPQSQQQHHHLHHHHPLHPMAPHHANSNPLKDPQSGRATPFPAAAAAPATATGSNCDSGSTSNSNSSSSSSSSSISSSSTGNSTTPASSTSAYQQPQVHPSLHQQHHHQPEPMQQDQQMQSLHHHHHHHQQQQTHHEPDTSGFTDDDCTRPINWGSVLSLSSQSALDPLTGNDLFVTSPTGPEPVVSSVVVVDSCDEDSLVDGDGTGGSSSSSSTTPNSQSGPQVVGGSGVEGVDGQSGGASTRTVVVSGSNPNGSGSDGASGGDATAMVVDGNGADLGVVESVTNTTGSNSSSVSGSSSGSNGNSTTTTSSSTATNDVNGGDDVDMDSGVSQVAVASIRRSLEGDRGSSASDADDVVDPSVPAAPSATAATGSDGDDHSISSSSTTTLTSLTTLTSSNSSSSVGSGRGDSSTHLTTLTSSSAVSPLLSSCASAMQHYSTLQQQHHLHAFQHHQLHQHHQHPVAAAAGSGNLTGTTGSNGSSGISATSGSSSCWEFAYLDMDLGTTHELYDMFPSCYKITSFNSGDHVDMLGLKGPMLEGPSKVVCGDNEMDSFTTHIMVGS
ncbi:uncharacterized protein LOC131284359 [Anopheles ziemanni]|uniref:uncharacterized protein LOC131272744 n=1 Tax=Anopheles coustani TaxID=139045 RepID=UPI002658A8FF|nr:uncharacterized protein LOC131272744 [Anopheles coustani]XP_058169196.1 uncharacterized protein LOC131284359 [Anopheles ziemanni]